MKICNYKKKCAFKNTPPLPPRFNNFEKMLCCKNPYFSLPFAKSVFFAKNERRMWLLKKEEEGKMEQFFVELPLAY